MRESGCRLGGKAWAGKAWAWATAGLDLVSLVSRDTDHSIASHRNTFCRDLSVPENRADPAGWNVFGGVEAFLPLGTCHQGLLWGLVSLGKLELVKDHLPGIMGKSSLGLVWVCPGSSLSTVKSSQGLGFPVWLEGVPMQREGWSPGCRVRERGSLDISEPELFLPAKASFLMGRGSL